MCPHKSIFYFQQIHTSCVSCACHFRQHPSSVAKLLYFCNAVSLVMVDDGSVACKSHISYSFTGSVILNITYFLIVLFTNSELYVLFVPKKARKQQLVTYVAMFHGGDLANVIIHHVSKKIYRVRGRQVFNLHRGRGKQAYKPL